MKYFHLKNHWFIWPLFLLLTFYATLRALFVEPLFDELGTFYWYIQTGLLPGHGAALDANNHILNSTVGSLLYTQFGDHFILYRLLPLISFPIYFFSARYLLTQSNHRFSVVTFLAIVSVHWVFDYFTLSRGYGPSLAFFLLALSFIVAWTKSFKTRHYVGSTLCFILIPLSNLSMLVPVLLLFGYQILIFCLFFRSFKIKQRLLSALISVVFLAYLIPVFIYLNKLNNAGALWWGSKEGLWEVTGKSLLRNTLFTEHVFWKFVLIFILGCILVLLILDWKKTRNKSFLLQPTFIMPVLLGLCLLSAVLMAVILNVNYPMDRIGMYLVPLFLLTIGMLFQQHPYFRWVLISLVWFPLSFVWNLNLDTTVFSPSDRIHQEFYDKMQTMIGPDDVLSADYVSHASYAYLSRKEKQTRILLETPDDSLAYGTFHLSWFGDFNESGYRLVLRDPITNTSLYKRVSERRRTQLLDTLIPFVKSEQLRIPLLELPITSNMQHQRLIQTSVSGTVDLPKGVLGVSLCHELLGAENKQLLCKPTRFDWYFGHKTHYSFSFPNKPYPIDSTHQKLAVVMMNYDLVPVQLKNVRIRVYLSGE